MIAYWDLRKGQLLALIAANLEPLRKCSDGRWRSLARCFPADGLSQDDLDEVESEQLIEYCPLGAIITDKGRAVLYPRTAAELPAALTAARASEDHAAHHSLQ
ncbi:MAG: hypothetical protein JO056_00300 [Alphaproteobacteria bacterium]|jgi:hypothetical protein|nr:hypothetical protein [Alphaproteobacteria bacterium]